tara:strand:+ start:1186 stop:1689 length:504 start_codon:yes stop_codon:yes gene_type:complete
MSWEDKTQVKKGNIGESIVKEYLESIGYMVYEPVTKGEHSFDKIAVKDKNNILIVEVKTKARMNKFNATGFDIRVYKHYKSIKEKYNIPLYCFFVDEYLGKIYGNELCLLEKKYIDVKKVIYPNTEIANNIILFSLDSMHTIHSLSNTEINQIKKHNTRNYNYNIKN